MVKSKKSKVKTIARPHSADTGGATMVKGKKSKVGRLKDKVKVRRLDG